MNGGVALLYVETVRTERATWLPLVGAGFGLLAAEVYLLPLYLAFSTQAWMPRLLTAWLISLSLLAGLGCGLVTVPLTPPAIILNSLGIIGICASVLVVAGATGLWMLGRVQGIHWARIGDDNQSRISPPTWSIFDLMVLTIIVAVSFALLRGTRMHFASSDQLAEFAAGMLTAAVFAVMNAPVTCLVTMYLLIRCDSQHTAWRPVHLSALVVCLALVVLFGMGNSLDVGGAVASTVLAALLSYATAIVAALMVAHRMGWQLEWERTEPTGGGLQSTSDEQATS